MEDKMIYAVALAALMVLGYAAFGMPARQPDVSAAAGAGAYATAQLSGPIPPECGDINDAENLQHLSHHPDQFQECYKVVDAGKFQQAVGQPLSNFMKKSG